MSPGKLSSFAIVLAGFLSGEALAQSPRVLYTWPGTGNAQGWVKAFGDTQEVTIENTTEGELTITETGTEGAPVAISDDANIVAEGEPSLGGLDLTGLSALEFDLGHDGADPIDVQFFVQATPAFTFIALGPDQPVDPGVGTYTAPLTDLLPDQIAYIRVIGISIRDHSTQGNTVWTLREVRSAGEPLAERDFATHEPGTSDGGLQGAFANFETTAIEGNDGGQNQTGLTVNDAEPPAGNTGSLHWVDLGGRNGAAVTWGNGTVFNGNSFNERPTDMSNYTRVVVRIAATNVTEGAVASVVVQYFLQTGNFSFHAAGPGQELPADGEFHDLSFPIGPIPRLDVVETHGINLGEHLGGDLVIDIDYVRAYGGEPFPDCNQNNVPDERELAEGTSDDCNLNALPDECDISSGHSADCNSNEAPDECDVAGEEYVRLIYTWEDLDDTRGWFKQFGANELEIVNEVEGELSLRENGAAEGTGAAVSDSFNMVAEVGTSVGGLDLVGMTALELDLGHDGTGDVMVQFFVQATPGSTYLALGPDQAISPEVKTYKAPLRGLTLEQITYIRTIGINIRDHPGEGNLEWTLREVRASGERLSRRDFATHDAGTSDNGLQGAIVSLENAAVEGNDGGQNQTGLRHRVAGPPGSAGGLQWTDLAGQGGGVVSWFNGTAFAGDTFNERPTDMSSYSKIIISMSATNDALGEVLGVGVLYFLQTGNFRFSQAGEIASLPADGRFHDLEFPIRDILDREFTDGHGIDIQDHADGTLIIDVDRIRAVREEPGENDCNGNAEPDDCDIAGGILADANQNGVPDACEQALFLRGDADASGSVNITDAVRILNVLFLGLGTIACDDSADADDNGSTNITDAIRILNVLFNGIGVIPSPGFESCGPDPTEDILTTCAYEAC